MPTSTRAREHRRELDRVGSGGSPTGVERVLVDAANFSIISTDPRGTILTFNAAAEHWLGYRAGEIIGKTSPVLFHDPAEIVARAEELSAELGRPVEPGFGAFVARARLGEIDEQEWTYVRKDGRRFPVRLSVTPLLNSEGGIAGFLGIASDITVEIAARAVLRLAHDELESRVAERTGELARANTLLRESEGRLRPALSAARVAQWEWDVATDRVVSHDLEILFGRPEGQPFASAAEVLEAIHPDDRDIVTASLEDCILRGSPCQVEYRVVYPDGSVRWLAAKGGALSGDGRPSRFAGITIDITERRLAEDQVRQLNEELERKVEARTAELKRAAEALYQSEDQFRGAFEAAAIGMALVAPDGRWIKVNRSLCRIVGYEEDELLQQTFQDITYPDDLEADLDQARRLLAGEIPSYQLEKRYLHRDGHVVWVVLSVSLVRDAAGLPLYFVSQINDITAKKQAEDELLRARDEALAGTRAKGEFLANMSHEIRTPMNGVLGIVDLLLDTELNDLQRDHAETIRSSGEALLTVINDILDFSKIEAGKLDLDAADFDPWTLIEDVAELLAPSAHQKGLTIGGRVAPDVPNRLVGDPVRLRQVLTNLAGNAVKFTDQGRVDLDASLLAEAEGRATLRVLVRDTGIGIPADRQADIFESFTQVEGGNSRRHGGTGLGLAICRRLVDLMGGRIGLESMPGLGSTFWFEVTLGRADAAAEPDVTAAGVEGLSVLVVDADEADRSALAETLARWGCRVAEAGSDVEALATLLESGDDPFELIVIDGGMPGLGADQVARAIKASPLHRGIPLARLSPSGEPGVGLGPEGEPWSVRLTKPIRRLPLANALRRAIVPPGSRHEPMPAADSASARLDSPPRVLVAEDNEINRRVVVGILEQLGCPVEAVCNGRNAVAAFGRGGHDLILMDVQMPEMDGFAATAAIREREQRDGGHIPIVALTAHAMLGDRERCLAAGMDGYLTKPIRRAPLREAILAWTAHRPPARPARTGPADSPRSFSAEALHESCGGDPELTREVLRLLLDELPAQLDALAGAVFDGDTPRVSRIAHDLKGTFATVGAEALALAAVKLMEVGERGDRDAIEAAHRPIAGLWAALVPEARRHLDALDDAAGTPDRPALANLVGLTAGDRGVIMEALAEPGRRPETSP